LIEKFNFYDIYGYFLPGLGFLGVLWLPFLMLHSGWPPSEWGSAIAALAIAYLLGHLLHGLGTNALPSEVSANKRYPSAAVLDPGSGKKPPDLPDAIRNKISAIVLNKFGLDLGVSEVGKNEIDAARNTAFSLARQTLSKDKVVSYPEQFEGMYALSRGLAVALGLGSFYFLGWSASSRQCFAKPVCISATIAVLLLVIVCLYLVWQSPGKVTRTILERICLFAVGATLLCFGYYLGWQYDPGHAKEIHFGLVAVAMLIASLRFYSAYKFFAIHFAKTVWRDFLAFSVMRTADSISPS
jgi:hypothetical protein